MVSAARLSPKRSEEAGGNAYLFRTHGTSPLMAAFFGHLFPLFTKFKGGGKGVATTAGCFIVLAPMACLASMAAFIVLLLWSRRVSAGSLAAAAVLPVTAWLFTDSWQIAAGAAIMSVFIFIRHRDNIRRFAAGTEPKFRDRSH